MFLWSEWRPNKMSLGSFSKPSNYIFSQELPISRKTTFCYWAWRSSRCPWVEVRKLRRAFHTDHSELSHSAPRLPVSPKEGPGPSHKLNLQKQEQGQSWCALKGYTVHHLPLGLGYHLLWFQRNSSAEWQPCPLTKFSHCQLLSKWCMSFLSGMDSEILG